MTTTDTERTWRQLTQPDFAKLAIARFGENATDWAYVCPNCGDVATARDFPPGARDRAGVECIGRHLGALDGAPGPKGREQATRGCNRAAYGPIPGPWTVEMPGGELVRCFALADAPQAPQAPPYGTPGTPERQRAQDLLAALSAPARTLSVERRTPVRQGMPGGGEILDMENWDYRVALGADQAVVGYRNPEPERPITVMLADSAALLPCAFHDLAPDLEGALRHVAAYDLPITDAELALALSLIVQAHDEDVAAAKIPTPTQEFLAGPPASRWLPMDEAPHDDPRPFVHDA